MVNATDKTCETVVNVVAEGEEGEDTRCRYLVMER